MRHQIGWEAWEQRVNAELGLQPTLASGSQFHDKGDGVDRGQGEYAYMVDAKYTERISFSVGPVMKKYVMQASMSGKKFALCVRLWARGQVTPQDYAVIPFDDFVDLVEKARHWERNA